MAGREEFLQAFQTPESRNILALDDMSHAEADAMMVRVGDFIGVAKENDGADVDGARDSVMRLADRGFTDMLDWKLHDTPGTVRNRARNLTSVGASLITVHTPGGLAMLEAAVRGRDEALASLDVPSLPELLQGKTDQIGGLLGITVLTSLSTEPGPDGEPSEVELMTGGNLEEIVVRRARLAVEAGLTGVVCSGAGLQQLRSMPEFDDLVTVVPGTKLPKGEVNEGQQQVTTPEAAFDSGADFVVAGSAVTQSEKKNDGLPAEAAAEHYAKAAQRLFS